MAGWKEALQEAQEQGQRSIEWSDGSLEGCIHAQRDGNFNLSACDGTSAFVAMTVSEADLDLGMSEFCLTNENWHPRGW